MKATINWAGNARFDGHSGSGHNIVMDGPPDHGGSNQGPRPMENAAAGTGCMYIV
jgi:putative redox protein